MDPEFTTPASIQEAVYHLQKEGALAVGGGTQVGLMLRHGLIEPSRIVWLGRIAELTEMRRDAGGSLLIGAATTLAAIAASPLVRAVHPMLADTASRVGNARVRAVATVGGHLAHADPRQDLPPCLLVLSCRLTLEGPDGRREVPLHDFFRGPLETTLREGELVMQVIVPALARSARCRYLRFTPGSSLDYPTVGVAACVDLDGGVIRHASVGLSGVAPAPLHVEMTALVGSPPDPARLTEAGEIAAASCDPAADQRGTAAYKRAMAALWTRRALRACSGPNGG